MSNNQNLKSYSEFEKIWEAKMDPNVKLELSNGYSIVGPKKNLLAAQNLVKIINAEMKSVFAEYKGEGESRAMDERDDVIENFQDQLKKIGFSQSMDEAEVNYHEGSPKADQAKIDALENKLKEYWGISSDIDSITKEIEELLKKKLGALPDKLKGVQGEISKEVEALNIQKIKTDKVVATFRKSYKQPTVSYKPMFETALTKVNGDTRKILEALVSQFTKESTVAAKVDIKRENVEVNEGKVLDRIRGFFSKGLDYVLNLFTGGLRAAKAHLPELDKSTNELAAINQQIAGHEEGKANREVHGWQADQFESKKEKGWVEKKDALGSKIKVAKKGYVQVSGPTKSTFKKLKK